MGTRADFYVGRGKDAEWLGSIAYDGYPEGAGPESLIAATEEANYRALVDGILVRRDDATRPEMGWPWPWENSQTTDYAYAFDDGKVWASCFGDEWTLAAERATMTEDELEALGRKRSEFPDMTKRQSVTLGRRSGVLILGVPK